MVKSQCDTQVKSKVDSLTPCSHVVVFFFLLIIRKLELQNIVP